MVSPLLLVLLAGLGPLGSASGRAALEEAYRDVLGAVSPGQQSHTAESVRRLLNMLENRVQCGAVSCEKCNLTESIHQLISNHSIHGESDRGEPKEEGEEVVVSVSEFGTVAAGCLFYLSSPSSACTTIREGRWGEETQHFLHGIAHREHRPDRDHGETTHEEEHQHEHMDIRGLEALLEELEGHYKPLPHETHIAAGEIMAEVDASSAAVGQTEEGDAVLGRVLYHVLRGHSFLRRPLPEESFFLDYIIEHIGSENSTVTDLEVLMRSLKLGSGLMVQHGHQEHGHQEHGHQEDGHQEDGHQEDGHQEHGHQEDGHQEDGHQEDGHQEDGHQEHGHHEHGDEHTDHDHSDGRRKRSSHHHHEEHGRNTTWDQRCFSAGELMSIYRLMSNRSAASALDRSDLVRLSPALVQQILSGACTATADPTAEPDDLSQVERYIYATIANVIITLTSMFGIVVLLCTSCSNVFQYCIQFCISLAVGSLTGDALLHLLPMFLGLHVHAGDDGGRRHSDPDHEHGPPDYIYKMLVVMAGIYYFYLMETIFSLVTRNKDNHHHHPHHHGEESEPHHCDHGRVLEMYQQERKQDKLQATSKADLVDCEDNEKAFPQPNERSREQRLLPYMITIGDGIHNFADGLAMGAAFSLSWRSGLATSLAVLCHELPHELGDFAILLHSGVSVRKALLLNVGSAMTSFIGLYIALSVATDLATKQWIAAITAGLFLYVGLADMLPTMIHVSNRRPWLMFLLQNIGLLSGWAILLVMSLYEDQIGF
ncbi:zinc transporter ZIP4 [Diretmus argenteus]